MRRLSPGHSQGEDLYAPRSHAPLASSSFAPPLSAFSENRPNFALGFGLDISEEEEEATDQPQVTKHAAADTNPVDSDDDEDEDLDDGELDGRDGSTTAPNSRYHSRHVPRKRLKCQGEFPTSLIHHRTLRDLFHFESCFRAALGS